jgi:hypothetical protein
MSYGTDAAQGFVERIPLTGATWNTATTVYPIKSGYATAIYTGDPVQPLNDGTIGRAVPSVSAAGNLGVIGVFKGVIYTDATNVKQFLAYWPAATATLGLVDAEAYVIDDPNVEFDIQAGTSNAGAHTATINQTDINLNADFAYDAVTAGSTRSGISRTYLNMATAATTATLNCRILRLTPVADGAPGGTNPAGLPHNTFGTLYNNAIVTFNNHVLKGGQGTAGV